jgi:hypothetical protein
MAFFASTICLNYEKPDFIRVPSGDSIELRRIRFASGCTNRC